MDDDHFFTRQNRYELNSRIMITAIVSLAFVVILVTILHIYAKLMLRRQIRRQAALRSLGITTTNSAGTVHTATPPKTGLDPSVIASLPIFVFKQTNIVNSNETLLTECSVCLCVLEDGEMARTLPNCKHTFHAECIDQWLGSNSTCPICRTGVVPRLVTEPREGMTVPPSAPPHEGTSDSSAKVGGLSSRFSSFRRMLSREGSSRRTQIQSREQEDGTPDLERQ